MKTKAQPKPPPQAPQKSQDIWRDEIEEAIKHRFSAQTGRIAIRPLWSDGSMHRFRVNWWGKIPVSPKKGWTARADSGEEEGIIRSCYLKIVADEEGIEITEVT